MAGFLVAIDGPSGIGKSTVTGLLARQLEEDGYSVLATREPTDTPLGNLARFGTDDYHGLTLACLVAADRYRFHRCGPAGSATDAALYRTVAAELRERGFSRC